MCNLEFQCIQNKKQHISGPRAKTIPLLETSPNKGQMVERKETYLKADVLKTYWGVEMMISWVQKEKKNQMQTWNAKSQEIKVFKRV